MQGEQCMVRCCSYVAESEVESPAGRFAVCPLHDAPQVVALLARGEQPHAYWHAIGKPIVLPCGPLSSREVRGDFGRAFDDPRLAEVNDKSSAQVAACYDLTQMEWKGE
jgi:hypothetical protein